MLKGEIASRVFLEDGAMRIKKVLVISLRILAVCLLFAVCMGVGTALSGLDRVAQQGQPGGQASSQTPQQAPPAAQVSQQTPPRTQQAPSELFVPLVIFSVSVGIVVSYLILRSSWHGWTLAGAMFVGMYGISTVVSQLESIFLLSSKLPHGMIRALFLQGAIGTGLFAPLAVLVLGKWRTAVPEVVSRAPARMSAASAAWRLVVLIIAFVFLYLFFGYYVAWQNPELRRYYGGPDWPNFLASLRGNWQNSPWIFALASFRALLHVAFVYPLIRMLRAGRWESALAAALFLACWTTVLLLPNPLMPASVARSHFWETVGFNLVFGSLLGWLLSAPSAVMKSDRP
jgi:hypothetical protein